jgi:hypothetical protein
MVIRKKKTKILRYEQLNDLNVFRNESDSKAALSEHNEVCESERLNFFR